MTSWRKWAFYGALIGATYTALDTYADLGTKPVSLYVGKMLGGVIAGAVLGGVAALVRNRGANRNDGAASPDRQA